MHISENQFSLWIKGIDDGKVIRLVLCDITKAFDKSIGISGGMLQWFINYISNRRQRAGIRGRVSLWLKVPAGVPQGSILGPTLFLVYINDILNGIKSNIRLFADDTSLFKVRECHHVTSAFEQNLNLTLLYAWASRWLVIFNPLKFSSLMISKKRTNHNYYL